MLTYKYFFILIMIHQEIPFSCLKFDDYEDEIQHLLRQELISTQDERFLLTDFGSDIVQAAYRAAREKLDADRPDQIAPGTGDSKS